MLAGARAEQDTYYNLRETEQNHFVSFCKKNGARHNLHSILEDVDGDRWWLLLLIEFCFVVVFCCCFVVAKYYNYRQLNTLRILRSDGGGRGGGRGGCWGDCGFIYFFLFLAMALRGGVKGRPLLRPL